MKKKLSAFFNAIIKKIHMFFELILHNRKAQIITGVVVLLLAGGITTIILLSGGTKYIIRPSTKTVVVVPGPNNSDPGESLPDDSNEQNGGDEIDYTKDPEDYTPDDKNPGNTDSRGTDSKDTDPENTVFPPSRIDTFVKYTAPFTADSESVIYNVDVSAIGADKTGRKNSSLVIQAAIDAVAADGGGTVYIPAGKYRLKDTLSIPKSVMLTGDWVSPEKGGGKGEGTVLLIYADRGKSADIDVTVSPIMMEGGIKNLSFWYPQQNPDKIVPYPYTITSTGMVSIMNLTFYNSYEGINSLSCTLIKMRGIYGTFLKTGINASEAYDVPRFEMIRIDTAYWKNSGLQGAPTSTQTMNYLNKYTRYFLNGMVFGRLDWGTIYDYKVRYAKCGILHDAPSGGHFSMGKFEAEYVNYGLYIEQNVFAIQVMDAKINASKAGIYGNATLDGMIMVSNTTFASSPEIPKYAIEVGAGLPSPVSVNDCVFEGWGTNAIKTGGHSLSISNTKFLKSSNMINADSVTSERFQCSNNTPAISSLNSNISAAPQNVVGTIQSVPDDFADYQFAQIKEPAKKTLYNVSDYGVSMNGSKDASRTIQEVLDLAGANGGGFVVLPAGRFRIDHPLVVPSGVELRSMIARPEAADPNSTCILLVYAGKGSESGALITLQEGAGLKNIRILYPEQGWSKIDSIIPYPVSVRCNKNTWVYNVTPVNSYNAFDLMTNQCDNAIVAEIQGCAFKTFVNIGHGSKNVTLQSVHGNPTLNEAQPISADLYWDGVEVLLNTTNFMILGDAPQLKMMSTFSIFSGSQFRLVKDPHTGGSYQGSVYMTLIDGAHNGIVAESGCNANIKFINSMFVAMFHEEYEGHYLTGKKGYTILTESGFTGTVSVYNVALWGGDSYIANVNGGTVNMTAVMAKGNNIAICTKGTLNLMNLTYGYGTPPKNEASGTGKINSYGCLSYRTQ